jgi:hypothetical protein
LARVSATSFLSIPPGASQTHEIRPLSDGGQEGFTSDARDLVDAPSYTSPQINDPWLSLGGLDQNIYAARL